MARNFDVSAPTVGRYLDLLTDTFLVRQLPPLHVNLKKRLVKAPKIYFRDTGLLHTLLGVRDLEELHGHPALGASCEGFALEQVLAPVHASAEPCFFRAHSGPELDLVLRAPKGERLGVEFKYGSTPKVTRGMLTALEDADCSRGFVVTPAGGRFPLHESVEAISLAEFVREVIGPTFARATG